MEGRQNDDWPGTENDEEEDLVAFLDGELPAEQARLIERRLETDQGFKRRADQLRLSWELLDCLPENPPDQKLAETTIELVAMKLREEKRFSLKNRLQQMFWPLLAIATLVALMVGAGAAAAGHRWQAQQLLRTLPMLTRYSDIKLIDSPQWLQELAQVDSLIDAGLPLYQETGFPALPQKAEELASWIDGLDPVLRLKLYEDAQSFQALPRQRQKMLREVHELASDSQSVDYSQTLKAYAGLISQVIGSAELAQLESSQDLNQRAAKIAQVVNRELAIAYAGRLSDDEKMRLRQWTNQIMDKNFDYFVEQEDPDTEIVLLLDMPTADSIIQPEDIADLIERIDPAGRALLDRLDERQRLKSLRLWLFTSSPINRERPQYSGVELRERFHELPIELQNRLIYLPGSEVIKVLTDNMMDNSK